MGKKSTATIEQKQVMADLLQAYMDKRGWGPTQAAHEIGVARTTLNAWTSLTSLPEGENEKKVAAALNYTIDELRLVLDGIKIEADDSPLSLLIERIRRRNPQERLILLGVLTELLQEDFTGE
ncbi:MAG: helix-turn-helix domain-containing protein [Microcoleus sp.]